MALLSMRLKYSYLTEYDLNKVVIDFKGTIKGDKWRGRKDSKRRRKFDIWNAVDEFIEASILVR